MNISQIEENVKSLVKKIDKESFIYDMLLAYGAPKATITRAKNGSKNLSKNENEIVIKKKIFFAHFDKDVDKQFARLSKEPSTQKHDPRFLIVTDYKTVKALDTKLDDKLEFPIEEFTKKFDFFLPLAGIEKKEFKHENPVDVKAAEKLAKLFDLIKKDNPKSDEKSLHSLNVFLTRLLFCYFAEDTNIFQQGLFTDSVGSHTQSDGSDLSEYLEKIFEIMNLEERPKNTPDYLTKFPYVNGGLFAETHPIPKFTKTSRGALLDIGDLNWAEINPDIFGSMIQAVVHPDQRAGLGMHYTSVSNIMKVIEPLFLNELYEEFEKSKKSSTKLRRLLERVSKIKIFDPACGSGNFLIIAYKELRKIEIKILKELNELVMSGIGLSNFFGIELDDFAHEVAVLSLWLAEHQMDVIFKEEFGDLKPSLPLKDGGNIICGNAAQVDWETVCPKTGEIYILGNPPYLGARGQSSGQKKDMKLALFNIKGTNNLDYISIWFKKGAEFIKDIDAKCAFVSTNSISQGVQVSLLWPAILRDGIEIDFCHQSFKWTNNAKGQAGVTCVIIGLRNISKKPKYIFNEGHKIQAKNINAYLLNFKDIYIESRRKGISDLPPINYGSFALDDGKYTLSESEANLLVNEDSRCKAYIRDFVGAKELIQGKKRYCLWFLDDEKGEYRKIKVLNNRVKHVKSWRSNSDREATKRLAETPERFAEIRQPITPYLAFPTVSSERRPYIPVRYYTQDIIASNQVYVVPGAEMFHFGILSSLMHITWVRIVGGQLETRIRYSSAICYNNFPVPEINLKQKEKIEDCVKSIFMIRERFSEKTLSQLYDPDTMPAELFEAHLNLDRAVDEIYSKKPLANEMERLEVLLKLYLEAVGT
ncbi:MAG: SAM-dependent methyltransferase [Peredibacter sp.]|nr:SAM-dependent methyltransferase [Peredibacter sp.]